MVEKKKKHRRENYGLEDVLSRIKIEKNRTLLRRWVDERISNGFSLKTSVCILYSLKKLNELFNKDFNEVTKEDITLLLKDNNKEYYKKTIKSFFKWLKGDDNPEIVKWIIVKPSLEEIKNKRERFALTQKEIFKIINACDNQRDKTIISLMVEYPLRAKDIIGIKYKDVICDKYGFRVKIFSKSKAGKREIRLIRSIVEMQRYLETYPYKDDPEAPLFFQYSNNRYGQPLGSWYAISQMIERIIKRTNLNKKITPHDLRHSTCTALLKDERLSTEEVKVLGGWNSLRTMERYSHVDSKSVGDKLLQINGGKKEEEKDLLKPINCPRCKNVCSATDDFCKVCHQILNIKETLELEEKEQTSLTKLHKALLILSEGADDNKKKEIMDLLG